MTEKKYEINHRKSINTRLTNLYHNDSDFIEVTEWTNGEGYDITISDKQQFSLHYTEWDILKKLIKKLDK